MTSVDLSGLKLENLLNCEHAYCADLCPWVGGNLDFLKHKSLKIICINAYRTQENVLYCTNYGFKSF